MMATIILCLVYSHYHLQIGDIIRFHILLIPFKIRSTDNCESIYPDKIRPVAIKSDFIIFTIDMFLYPQI